MEVYGFPEFAFIVTVSVFFVPSTACPLLPMLLSSRGCVVNGLPTAACKTYVYALPSPPSSVPRRSSSPVDLRADETCPDLPHLREGCPTPAWPILRERDGAGRWPRSGSGITRCNRDARKGRADDGFGQLRCPEQGGRGQLRWRRCGSERRSQRCQVREGRLKPWGARRRGPV